MARRSILCALVLLLVATLSFAQTVKRKPAPYTNPASGQEMFKAYCASCHGLDGKGNGPAASAMKSPVPDLTLLAKNNGGAFPSERVTSEITGDTNRPAHGTPDMPVWGPVFMRVSHGAPAQVQQRVRNLTDYVGSLQAK